MPTYRQPAMNDDHAAGDAGAARSAFASQIEDRIMQIRDLDFYYGKFRGLKNVNLDIARQAR